MQNKISAVLSDEDKAIIKSSFNTAVQKMPFLFMATKEEKTARQNLGDGSDFVLKALNVVQNRGEIMPQTFNPAEFQKDQLLHQQLYDVQINLMPILQKLQDTITILGQELMEQSNSVYGQLQIAAKRDSSLKPLLDEMKPFYEKTKKKSIKTVF